MSDHWKVSAISIGCLLLLGIMPSIYFDKWHWFSRSGSLLVCYGVFIAWRNFKELPELMTLASKAKEEFKCDHEHKFLDTHISGFEGYGKSLELLVICLGTLVWGYGDLLDYIFS